MRSASAALCANNDPTDGSENAAAAAATDLEN
jgi:hypothetical protein